MKKMSSSPHIRSKATTGNIMLYVIIALLPASAFGVFNFGISALLMLVTTTATAVLTEYVYQKLMHKKITIMAPPFKMILTQASKNTTT